MRARGQLTLGRRDAVGKIVQPVLDRSARPVMPWSAIEAWLVATDVPHPLVFAAPDVADLLTSQLGKLGGGATGRFAERVAAALRRELNVPPMVPLTARERAVLRLLPTLRSFDEIAEDLTVSTNTVKTHVRGHLPEARCDETT